MTWKTIAIALVTILGLMLIGMVWWVASYDHNRFKPLIAAQFETLLGRKLVIEGDLGIRLRLPLTLTADDIRLQNATWGSRPDMLAIKRLEIQIGLWALWNRALEIRNLRLVGPDILIERSASTGKFNWESEQPVKPLPVSEPAESKGFEWSLSVVTVENGHFRWVNHADGSANNVDITVLQLKQHSGPMPVKTILSGRYNERTFLLEGTSQRYEHLIRQRRPWLFDVVLETEGGILALRGEIKARPKDKTPRPDVTLSLQSERFDLRPWLGSSESVAEAGGGQATRVCSPRIPFRSRPCIPLTVGRTWM